jgi:hypothetical protein
MLLRSLPISIFTIATFAFLPNAEALRWPPNAEPVTNPAVPNTPGRPRNHSGRKVQTDQYMQSKAYRRNQQRRDDVKTISNYLYLFKRDNDYLPPVEVPLKTPKEICRMGSDDCTGLLDLSQELSHYTESLPIDPSLRADSNGTGYTIKKDHKGKVTIGSLHREEGWIIEAQR